MNIIARLILLGGILLVVACTQRSPDSSSTPTATGTEAYLQPYSENPHYLAWGNTPVFGLGATGYHSWTPISRPGTMDFEVQLDRLADVMEDIDSPHVRGFVRALPYDPMNHMHDGPVERVLQPWVRVKEAGRYDLEQFEPAWEKRLKNFLDASLERDIIVSLELWDDWSVTRGPGGQYDPGTGAAWNAHPFNPANNVNFGRGVLPETTAVCNAPFYSTVPSRDHIEPVLRLQKLYVDRVLEIASGYPHVLINLSNESRAHLDWSRFWAGYVRDRVPERIMIGDMPSTSRDSDDGQCEPAFSPAALAGDSRYDFVDVAQAVSGHSFDSFRGQALGGGRRIQNYRRTMDNTGRRKPIVVSKDYGRTSDGGNRVLWSRLVGGAATARFHRLGAEHGQEVIDFQYEAVRRLGRFLGRIPFWRMHPAPELIEKLPGSIGANILADDERHLVMQIIGEAGGGDLTLNLSSGAWNIEWINPATGETIDRVARQTNGSPLQLDFPGDYNHRILYVRPAED